jgi:hypothetical protein
MNWLRHKRTVSSRTPIAAYKAHLESQHWLPAEANEQIYDGLRKAGMPEGEAKTN